MVTTILLWIFAFVGLQLMILIFFEALTLFMMNTGGKLRTHVMKSLSHTTKFEKWASYFYFIILLHIYLSERTKEEYSKWRMTQPKRSSTKQLKGLEAQIKRENKADYKNENT